MFKDLFSPIRIIYRKVKLAESLLKPVATDNPKVSGYLPPAVYNIPPAVYDQLMAFKAKRGLQSIEMAVTVILSEYFGVSQTAVDSATDTTSRLEALEAKCTNLTETVAELLAQNATLQLSSSPPLGESEPPGEQKLPLSLLDDHATAQSAANPVVESESPCYPLENSAAPSTPDQENPEKWGGELAIPEPLDQQFSTPMTQAALARRLGVNTSSISRMQSKPNFSEWSQQKDPDGIAWVRSKDTKLFYPQTR